MSWDRHWQTGAVFTLGLLVLTLAAMAVETRVLAGYDPWVKPAKFAASLALHLATLAVVAAALPARVREGWLMAALVLGTLAATIFEMGYIMLQAARLEHSHFNVAEPLHAALYTAMGIGAVYLVAAAMVLGGLVARERPAGWGAGLQWGAALGLIGGGILTIVVAGYMGGNGSHFVGTPSPEAGAWPITGWSTEVGDLRPAHFLALHAMQILPLAGLALDRWRPGGAVPVMVVGSVLYAALTLGLFAPVPRA
ncbi:MAG: hypothetical protein AAFW69_10775 [Pseudomonadota bacterium]